MLCHHPVHSSLLANGPAHQRFGTFPIAPASFSRKWRSSIHADKNRLDTSDENIALLVRNLTLIFYSLRPAGRAACFWMTSQLLCTFTQAPLDHAILLGDSVLHLRTGSILRMLKRFYLSNRNEHVRLLVAEPLLQVKSAEKQ